MRKMDSVVTTKLSVDTKFKFRCHKDIKCFTKCCSNIEIVLTPYVVVRLKKRLELSSDEFLGTYTYMKIDKKSSHPYAILKMNDDEDRNCPFVTNKGCTIYTDRPANCRYYPVGQGTMKKSGKDGAVEEEEFYFFIKEPHCFGFDEKKQWTIAAWRKDQEVDLYDRVNMGWKTLQLRKNLPGHELDPKKQIQFYMASYDLDKFRDYIFNSDFLNVFDIDEKTVEGVKKDYEQLIQFGVEYIKYIMMLEETLKLKKDAAKYRKSE